MSRRTAEERDKSILRMPEGTAAPSAADRRCTRRPDCPWVGDVECGWCTGGAGTTGLAAAWEAVAARRAADGTAQRWVRFGDLPGRQVVACRTLAALVSEFPDLDPVVLGLASQAAWRVIDDPAAVALPTRDDEDEDEDEDVAEARETFASEVASQWADLARELLARGVPR